MSVLSMQNQISIFILNHYYYYSILKKIITLDSPENIFSLLLCILDAVGDLAFFPGFSKDVCTSSSACSSAACARYYSFNHN
jgi:hypothetical protein